MPGSKSISGILVIIVVLVGFYIAPKFVGGGGRQAMNVNLGDIRSINLSGIPGDPVSLTHDSKGWRFTGSSFLRVDDLLPTNLLSALGKVRLAPAKKPFVKTFATVVLTDASGKKDTIEIGERIEPFKKQLIRLNGKIYEADQDIGACLNLWDRKTPLKGEFLLGDPSVYDLRNEPIVEIDYQNPFADYQFSLSGSAWQLKKGKLKIKKEPMDKYVKGLSWLVALGDCDKQTLKKAKFSGHLAFKTSGGKEFAFKISEPVNDKRECVCVMSKPISAQFMISDSARGRLYPRIPSIATGLTEFKLDPAMVVGVSAERGKHHFVLKSKKGSWSFTTPKVPYKIALTPPEPGMKRMSIAERYVEELSRFESLDDFNPHDSKRKAMLDKLKQPAALVTVRLKNKKSFSCRITPPLSPDEKCLLEIDKRFLIVTAGVIDRLVPDITTFFDPKEIKGKVIEW